LAFALELLKAARDAGDPPLWPFRSPARVDLAGVGDDPVREEIEEGSGGPAEAMRQQRQVASIVAAEVVDEQVRRREDRNEKPEDERRHEEGDDDEEDKDRQRRAHQEPDEHDGRHLDGAERTSGCEACHQGVLLELLGG
jgi:hypothetical protein